MKALTIPSVGDSRLIDIAEPVPGPGEVLVTVSYVGLCGSDLNTFTGANPLVRLPRIPGHEISGTVTTLGEGVGQPLVIGARVVVVPYTNCGTCSACRKGRFNACRYNRTLGVQQEGGLTEKLVVAADKLIVNETIPLRRLALVEPLSVGFHAVRRGRIGPGDRVVVLGCGMVGIGAVIGAAAAGAKVIATDLSPGKRDIVLQMGAAHFADATDAVSLVHHLTGGDGADVVIEAVGTPETFTQAIDLACYAGRVVYVGYSKQPVTYDTAPFNLKELDICGSRNATWDDFGAVIAHLEKIADGADLLVSRVFSMQEADQALPYWHGRRAETFKIMVEL